MVIGLILAIVGMGSVFYAPAFALVVIAIALGSLREFAQLSARKGTQIEFPVAFAAVLLYELLTAFGWIHRYEGVLLGATVLLALGSATLGARGNFLARAGYTLLAVLYIGKLLSYFIAIRSIPGLGIPLTLYAIILIALTDIWAMIVGVAIGKTPLTPISPRKTVEGSLGGLVAATLAGALFAITPALGFTWWQGALTGALVSLAAQAGDLVESALKRDAKVKDAGTAIGSHGGVLDRFDSYIFGGIAFYFAMFLIGIVPSR